MAMDIVVLDGHTLNPGDLSWTTLESLGNVTIYDRTPYDDTTILKRIGNAEIIFTNKTPISKYTIKNAPNLRYIGVLATGYNIINVAAAKTKNISVSNVPDYSTMAVAQFTFALILELCHNVGLHNTSVSRGDWIKSKDFSYWNTPLIELQGKTLGLIGFGKIGRATAKIAQAFGLHVLVYNRTTYIEFENSGLKFAPLSTLLSSSDFISLHCPLTSENKHIINNETISIMKNGAYIINTSRGPLVEENHLKNALNSGKLAGAALDVVSLEPMAQNNPLLQAKNCIITPHIAWAPKEARLRLMQIAVENLKAFLNGKPIHIVNN